MSVRWSLPSGLRLLDVDVVDLQAGGGEVVQRALGVVVLYKAIRVDDQAERA